MVETITLRQRNDTHYEAEAAGTITPGDLIEVSGEQTTGAKALPQVQRQSTDGEGGISPMFATEQRGQAGRGIDDDYSSGDLVSYVVALPGDKAYAWHNTAEDISYGDKLVASGDGTLRALDTAGGDVEAEVVAVARTAVSNATGTAKARMEIEVVN